MAEDIIQMIIDSTSKGPIESEKAPAAEPVAQEEPKAAEAPAADPAGQKQPEPEKKAEPTTDDIAKKVAELEAKESLTDEDKSFLRSNGYEIEGDDAPVAEKKEEPKTQLPVYAKDIESIFPDQEFKTAAEYEEAASRFIQNERAANQELVGLLEENPDLLDVLKEMRSKKVPFQVAIANVIDADSLIPQPGDAGYEAYVESKIIKKQEAQKQKERTDRIQKNYDTSLKTAQSFVKSKALNEHKTKEFFASVDKVINDITEGRYSDEFLGMVYKAMSYQTDVELAKRQGEIAGANKKIFKLRSSQKGDGLPKLRGSKDTVVEKSKQGSDPFLDMVEDIVKSRK
jgi:hypothetical protein